MLLNKTELLSPEQLKQSLPLSNSLCASKLRCDDELKKAITEKNKYIVVCGPCSADDLNAVKEYCANLCQINEKIKDKILLCPRIFTAKPRSKGEGYLGMLFGSGSDLNKGLYECRKLLLSCLEYGMPVADELLYLDQYFYYGDLVSFYFLGARTSESTPHRNFCSLLSQPVGIKNNTAGNLLSLADSLYCANTPKTLLYNRCAYQTDGNKLTGVVLRGGIDNDNNYVSNADSNSLDRLNEYCVQLSTKPSFVLVDCAHANSGKDTDRQIANALNVTKQLKHRINGVMLESYVNEGCDEKGRYGVSKTDPCIGLSRTEQLLLDLYSLL